MQLKYYTNIIQGCTFISLPNNPVFKWTTKRKLLKTLWEMEKIPITSIFSFSPNIFTEKFHCLTHIYVSSWDAFNLDYSTTLLFGKKISPPERIIQETILRTSINCMFANIVEKERFVIKTNFSFYRNVIRCGLLSDEWSDLQVVM